MRSAWAARWRGLLSDCGRRTIQAAAGSGHRSWLARRDAMTVSVFDLFTVGIGPSSSHTVGPMRAALAFARSLDGAGMLGSVAGVRAELFGSLGATGHGHGSVRAVVLGLSGAEPETVDPAAAGPLADQVRATGSLALLGRAPVRFDMDADVILHRRKRLEFHSNGMRFAALDALGSELTARTYYSVGGGFVLGADEAGLPAIVADPTPVPHPFASAAELLKIAAARGLPVSRVMLANELVRRDSADVTAGLLRIWAVMQECVSRGCRADGVLPGGLKVRRRARALLGQLERSDDPADSLTAMDWVTLWALAVNEENAAGGRVVTAPTNGAAGIIPAVLHYYARFVPGAD